MAERAYTFPEEVELVYCNPESLPARGAWIEIPLYLLV